MHIIAAKAVCFGEALKPEFKEYQKQVVNNAKALADALIAEGFNLVSGGTDNHLMLVDLQNMNITGKELQNRLDEVYITVNQNWYTGSYNKRTEGRGYEDNRKTDQDDSDRL